MNSISPCVFVAVAVASVAAEPSLRSTALVQESEKKYGLKALETSKSHSPWDGDDDDDDGDDEYEHGDVISHAKDEDASDYSMHQFLASDDGRGVAGADEDTVDTNADDDGAQDEVDKSAAEAEDNDFDSEDTPDDDSFMGLKSATTKQSAGDKKLEIRALNLMQSKGKTRSPWDGDDDDDDGDDEYEHGDVISHAKDEDASDYSMHQFLASDDGRGVAGADE